MYCYYCNHPLNIPQPQFKTTPTDHVPSGPAGVADVKCTTCEAVYEITAVVMAPTRMSLEQVQHVSNKVDNSSPLKAKGHPHP